jgi:hypothetical protein
LAGPGLLGPRPSAAAGAGRLAVACLGVACLAGPARFTVACLADAGRFAAETCLAAARADQSDGAGRVPLELEARVTVFIGDGGRAR